MRRIAVLVLTVLILAPAGVHAATWFRSAHDGQLRAACCCPAGARHHGPSAPDSEVRAACCCTIVQLAAHPGPERAAPPDAPAASTAVAPVAAEVLAPPDPMAVAVAAAALDHPRAAGPPDLFVRHCALLL